MRASRLFAAVAALVVGILVPVSGASASVASGLAGRDIKATLVGFSAGNIISDAVFTNKSTMTEAQIQTFFNSKVPKCLGGSDKYGPIVCLKDYKATSVNRPADAYCSGYTGATNESAARIIYRVAQSCNINPQVLIVMLQKEQGLVTHTWPSAWRYSKALGQGCPDGGVACDPNYVGFFHQIYGAARQMQIYMEGKWFTWYAPGKTWNILWHPPVEVSPGVWKDVCGSSPVYVANKATAALYYYTPYQPNAAALRAGYGEGDSCSAYGNRNFYNYFTDWFGPTLTSTFSDARVVVNGYVTPGQVITATGVFTPAATTTTYQWYRDGQAIAGATQRGYSVTAADAGHTLEAKATAKRLGYADVTAVSAKYVPKAITVDRIAGESRELTAVEASRAAWPSGTRTVYIAGSLGFADPLSATAAAGRADASLLLTPPTALPDAVGDELTRLAPTRVVLVGGTGVISDEVLKQVKTRVPAAQVVRVSGPDRYATSRAIVEQSGASERLILATGEDYPDALSAGAAGSASRTPLLLVNGTASAVDAATLATIRKISAKTITVVGGTGVMSEGIVAQLTSMGFVVKRLSGSDRYSTNAAVNAAYFPSTALKALLAAGGGFPDALSASVLAGRWGVPLLLTEQSCVVPAAADFIRQRGTSSVVIVGGAGVLSSDGVEQLRRCG